MLSQIQTQKQQMKILPQQIQMLNIFHLNVYGTGSTYS